MINHDLKFIYIRVTKTASTSFLKTFGQNGYPLKLVGDRNIIPEIRLPNRHHLPSKYIAQAVGQETFDSYLKIAFSRNPWDRMLTSYLMGKNYQRSAVFGKTFDGWLKEYEPMDPDLPALGKPKHSHPMPVFSFARGADFIGRFENLNEDFKKVCNLLGIPELKLLHLNRRKHKHYTEYYNDERKEIVAKEYAKDIQYFGYEFGK